MVIQAHNKLTFSGIFGAVASPVEVWQWSLKFAQLGDITSDDLTDELANASAARAAYSTHLAQVFGPAVRLTNTRYSRHNAGGLTSQTPSGGYVQADDATVVTGTYSSDGIKPLQTATCVSLMTARAGSTGRGRCFLPYLPDPIQPDYRYSESVASGVAQQFRSFILALQPAMGEARVFSSKGYSSVIEAVRVGRVPDTMRSRRGSMDEGYLEVAL